MAAANTLRPTYPPACRHVQTGIFAYAPTIKAVSGNVGSLAGGLPLTLTVGGAGLALGPDNATLNEVTVAGLPCPILSMPSATTVICKAPAVTGKVQADYWNLPAGTTQLPELQAWSKPGAARWSHVGGGGAVAGVAPPCVCANCSHVCIGTRVVLATQRKLLRTGLAVAGQQ